MEPRGWSLRKKKGDVYPLPDSATLQRWIVEGRVTREDEISRGGESWQKAGTLTELEPFFAVVDEAKRSRAARTESRQPTPPAKTAPTADEKASPTVLPSGESRSGSWEVQLNDAGRSDSWEVSSRPPDVVNDEPAWATSQARAPVQQPAPAARPARREPEEQPRRWPVLFILLVLLVVAGAASGAAVYFFRPDLIPAELLSFVRSWAGSNEPTSTAPAAPVAPAPAPPATRDAAAPPAVARPAPPPKAAPAPPVPPPAAVPESSPGPTSAPSPATGAAESPAQPSDRPEAGTAPVAPAPAAADASGAATAKPAGDTSASAEPTASPGEAPQPRESAAPSPSAAPAKPSAPRAQPIPVAGGEPAVPPAPKPTVSQKPPEAPLRAREFIAEARRLRERGRSDAALNLYGRALQLNPSSADALAGRGLCYLDLTSYPQAEESFQSALAVDESHGAALMGLAETYRYEGKRSDAVTYYRRYLVAHPKGEDAGAARNAIKALEE